MIFRWFSPAPEQSIIAALYGTIVAQARAPAFYRVYGVPDTVNGRLEMIILHVILFLQRLEQDTPELRRLGQAVFDRFCRDMDENMREMGVGDMALPRQMRRIGEAFYGRRRTYAAAVEATDGADLAAALERNVFAGSPCAESLRLADYVHAARQVLARQNNFGRGELMFPDPLAVLPRTDADKRSDQ